MFACGKLGEATLTNADGRGVGGLEFRQEALKRYSRLKRVNLSIRTIT